MTLGPDISVALGKLGLPVNRVLLIINGFSVPTGGMLGGRLTS